MIDAAKVKPEATVALCPSELVTVTLTTPAACAGVTAVILVLLTTVTLVAGVLPKVTVAPDSKPVPLSVTVVPPAVEPLVGETVFSTGPVQGHNPYTYNLPS